MTKPLLTKDQYDILSNRENFDDPKKQLIDKAKLDLLDNLKFEEKLMNRNLLSDELGKNRYENGIN